MSVQKFLGTIETDGVKDERGIETPSLSATGEVSGKTGVFSESVTAPAFNGKATSAETADNATNATNAVNDGAGNNIPDTYATKEALAEETSAREAADETLSKGITAEATERAQEISALQTGLTGGTITVAEATHATSADNATNATNASNAVNATQVNAQFVSTSITYSSVGKVFSIAIPEDLQSPTGVYEVEGDNGATVSDSFYFHGIVGMSGSTVTAINDDGTATVVFIVEGTIGVAKALLSTGEWQNIISASPTARIRRICL